MTPTQMLILVAMTAYAIYRQSQRHEVTGRARFKLALIYAATGLFASGWLLPPDKAGWIALCISVLASVLVGIARGRMTRVWREPDGRIFSQGTALTIALFGVLVAGKYAWGTWEYFQHAQPHAVFGEVLLMIAAMVGMQAEIIWRRARALAFGPAATG